MHIKPSGLRLFSTASFHGASGDGWVYSNNECIDMLKIKCPFSINDEDATKSKPEELARNPTFFLELCEGGPKLKSNHRYFDQIQVNWPLQECHGVTLWSGLKGDCLFKEFNLIKIPGKSICCLNVCYFIGNM